MNVAAAQPAPAPASEVPAALNPAAVAEALDAEPELPVSDSTDDNVSDEATHVDVVDPDLVASEEEEMTERQSEDKL